MEQKLTAKEKKKIKRIKEIAGQFGLIDKKKGSGLKCKK